MSYPSWRYHATQAPRLIHGPSEEHKDWQDSPAKVGRAAAAPMSTPNGTADGMNYEDAPITETPKATKAKRVVKKKAAAPAAAAPAPVRRAASGESQPPPPPKTRRK